MAISSDAGLLPLRYLTFRLSFQLSHLSWSAVQNGSFACRSFINQIDTLLEIKFVIDVAVRFFEIDARFYFATDARNLSLQLIRTVRRRLRSTTPSIRVFAAGLTTFL